MNETSIIIVGGGPVGSVLALALQQQDIAFTMLEARAKGASHKDTRALALSYGSRLILEKLGVWDAVAANATAIGRTFVSPQFHSSRSAMPAPPSA